MAPSRHPRTYSLPRFVSVVAEGEGRSEGDGGGGGVVRVDRSLIAIYNHWCKQKEKEPEFKGQTVFGKVYVSSCCPILVE